MVVLDGQNLQATDLVAIARADSAGTWPEVSLADSARDAVQAARAYVESAWLKEGAPPIYGFNTGVGKLKDSAIPVDQIKQFQRMLVNSHSAGLGEPFPEEVVRATMALRVNAFAKGHSALRPVVIDRLLAMLNAGLHPVIPQIGSVGASGDLAPLAYLTGALTGHPQAEVFHRGHRIPARVGLQRAGIGPAAFELEAKDALALINGSTLSLATAALAAADVRDLLVDADIALSLSLEAMRGELAAFDEEIHRARPHPGQVKTAENVRRITAGSQRCSEPARQVALPDEGRLPAQTIPVRVQDAYSLRCAAQVHGPGRDALEYADRILSVEMNAATDNPLIFPTADGYRALSGGNFHGQYIAQAMDLLAMAVADLGSISERRSYRLLDPTMSYGLPSNLVANMPGLNTGYAIAHCSMAALVTENKTLCWPAGADSIPTKSNQEDHVSNSTWSSRKARTVVQNVQQIVGTELLLACQAVDLTRPVLGAFQLGHGSRSAFDAVRTRVPAALEGDRWLHDDLAAARSLITDRAVSAAVEAAVGNLH